MQKFRVKKCLWRIENAESLDADMTENNNSNIIDK